MECLCLEDYREVLKRQWRTAQLYLREFPAGILGPRFCGPRAGEA
jgi:hypothetical protein